MQFGNKLLLSDAIIFSVQFSFLIKRAFRANATLFFTDAFAYTYFRQAVFFRFFTINIGRTFKTNALVSRFFIQLLHPISSD